MKICYYVFIMNICRINKEGIKMKKNYLKFILVSFLIFGNIVFSVGKADAVMKVPTAVQESKLNSSEMLLAKNDRTKLSHDRVKQIVTARVPGANASEIADFQAGADSFTGKLVHGGAVYIFEIDAYTGRAIKWDTNK